MTQDTDQILVAAGGGSVAVAPVGTPLPSTPTEALNAAFKDLGLLNDDGPTWRDSKTMEVIPVWQLFYPGRRIITARDARAEMVLVQWNRDTIPFAFGGGSVSSVSGASGVYRYQPPDPGDIDDRAMVITFVDEDKHYRIIAPRGSVTDEVESQLTKLKAAELPVTFSVIGQDGVLPWELVTDDPAWAP